MNNTETAAKEAITMNNTETAAKEAITMNNTENATAKEAIVMNNTETTTKEAITMYCNVFPTSKDITFTEAQVREALETCLIKLEEEREKYIKEHGSEDECIIYILNLISNERFDYSCYATADGTLVSSILSTMEQKFEFYGSDKDFKSCFKGYEHLPHIACDKNDTVFIIDDAAEDMLKKVLAACDKILDFMGTYSYIATAYPCHDLDDIIESYDEYCRFIDRFNLAMENNTPETVIWHEHPLFCEVIENNPEKQTMTVNWYHNSRFEKVVRTCIVDYSPLGNLPDGMKAGDRIECYTSYFDVEREKLNFKKFTAYRMYTL